MEEKTTPEISSPNPSFAITDHDDSSETKDKQVVLVEPKIDNETECLVESEPNAQRGSKRRRMGAEAHQDPTKACNENATYLQIGTWSKSIRNHDREIIAKLYFKKKKIMAWEILMDDNVKRRLEIKFEDVQELRFRDIEGEPTNGTTEDRVLEVLLKDTYKPMFFREKDPTDEDNAKSWVKSNNDFTGGQATQVRIHILRFYPKKLDTLYKKIEASGSSLSAKCIRVSGFHRNFNHQNGRIAEYNVYDQDPALLVVPRPIIVPPTANVDHPMWQDDASGFKSAPPGANIDQPMWQNNASPPNVVLPLANGEQQMWQNDVSQRPNIVPTFANFEQPMWPNNASPPNVVLPLANVDQRMWQNDASQPNIVPPCADLDQLMCPDVALDNLNGAFCDKNIDFSCSQDDVNALSQICTLHSSMLGSASGVTDQTDHSLVSYSGNVANPNCQLQSSGSGGMNDQVSNPQPNDVNVLSQICTPHSSMLGSASGVTNQTDHSLVNYSGNVANPNCQLQSSGSGGMNDQVSNPQPTHQVDEEATKNVAPTTSQQPPAADNSQKPLDYAMSWSWSSRSQTLEEMIQWACLYYSD